MCLRISLGGLCFDEYTSLVVAAKHRDLTLGIVYFLLQHFDYVISKSLSQIHGVTCDGSIFVNIKKSNVSSDASR